MRTRRWVWAGAAVALALSTGGVYEYRRVTDRQSKKSECKNNLKQLGGYLTLYVSRYGMDRTFPYYGWPEGTPPARGNPADAQVLGVLGSVRSALALYFTKNALPPPTGGNRPWWPNATQLRGSDRADELVVLESKMPDNPFSSADTPDPSPPGSGMALDGPPPVHCGDGALVARRPRAAGAPAGACDQDIAVPLKHTDVHARVSAFVGTVEVTQQFANPFDEKIEAEYVFPLPTDAAITDFIMTIGERRIRGIIRPREEARQIYQEARAQGLPATLLDQQRPNIFTQKIANLEPGKQIDVNITYFHCLPYVDGWYEFVYPMVVAPRYNPAGATDGIGAVAPGSVGASGQATDLFYLPADERSGHDIALTVDLDAGVSIEELRSPSHATVIERPTPETARVRLAPLDSVPNRDFVLRYRVAGRRLKANLLTHRDARGGFFALVLHPPAHAADLPRRPVEMVFVLDCSGSMSGAPIEKTKQAVTRALRSLRPEDSFQVVQFSQSASQLGGAPIPATAANVQRGIDYVESLNGEGGTEMLNGIRVALDFPHDPERYRIVSFWTDGEIGNEAQIFAEVEMRLGESRLFSFGIGSSVNRFLLDGLARMGKGVASYVGLDESAGDAVDAFYERVRRPALTDLRIDWGDLEVSGVYPSRLPDLLAGRPTIVTGRFAGSGKAEVRLLGWDGTRNQVIALPLDLEDRTAAHPGIAAVWARTRIAELEDALATGADAQAGERIRKLAQEFNLVSAFTSFVAVDSLTETGTAPAVLVRVPVPMPYGMSYFATVLERAVPAAWVPAGRRPR
ncbi:MAG: VWA domain-containing protein [Planctomycetes bacterium]|nr:VWA domain-containing protein [Planctomycetota bacterium]